MFQTKKPKQTRAVKAGAEPSQERRNFLRTGALGALGAAAAIATGVTLTGTPVRAAGQMRMTRKAGEVGTAGDAGAGKTRAMRSMGSIGTKGESTTKGTRSLRKATTASPKSMKVAKSDNGGTRSARTRSMKHKSAPKAMKTSG